MSGLVSKGRLALRLGLDSLAKFKLYQLKCRTGYFRHILPERSQSCGLKVSLNESKRFSTYIQLSYFFNDSFNKSLNDLFSCDPFTGNCVKTDVHWSDIKTSHLFAVPGSDIKVTWEPSRFYWLVGMVRHCNVEKYDSVQQKMDYILQHWCRENPFNKGFNWLCAQEVSIRLINYLLSMTAIDGWGERACVDFVLDHAKRIKPAMSYAMAQRNNHILSESVGLYYAGAWLVSVNKSTALAKRYIKTGRRVLEAFVSKLVLPDGTFSQYSITYHCMVIEIVTLALWVQKKYQISAFSTGFLGKCKLLWNWLANMVDQVSYDAPNLGSNDSTALYKIDMLPYRDFRVRLQTLSVLLFGAKVFEDSCCNEALDFFGIEHSGLDITPLSQRPVEFTNGGYVKFTNKKSWALLNYPKYKFRPSQADCMHFDLWVSGVNVLRDNGTYSYNAEPQVRDYFRGVESHNTIQFDHAQPMPMLSRFLFGDWVKARVEQSLTISSGGQTWCGVYKTHRKCIHRRRIACLEDAYVVTDEIDGFQQSAVLRWHLNEAEWDYIDGAWQSSLVRISVDVNGVKVKPVLYRSDQSLYYHSKCKKPALSVEIKESPAIVVTHIQILV